MREDQTLEIRREAAWAISNACSGGTKLQIKYIVSKGAIKELCNLLDSTDERSLIVALEGIDNILRAGEEDVRDIGENRYAIEVERNKGLDKIEELQGSDNVDIYEKATQIIESYYSNEHFVEEDLPSVGQFSFSLSSNTTQNTFFKL